MATLHIILDPTDTLGFGDRDQVEHMKKVGVLTARMSIDVNVANGDIYHWARRLAELLLEQPRTRSATSSD